MTMEFHVIILENSGQYNFMIYIVCLFIDILLSYYFKDFKDTRIDRRIRRGLGL